MKKNLKRDLLISLGGSLIFVLLVIAGVLGRLDKWVQDKLFQRPNAPGGCEYISRAVCDALGDRITVTSLGDTVKLKGKAEGFEVLKLETIS